MHDIMQKPKTSIFFQCFFGGGGGGGSGGGGGTTQGSRDVFIYLPRYQIKYTPNKTNWGRNISQPLAPSKLAMSLLLT
jgi:hypothetical protein